jgi:hypothetical protein
VVYRAIQVSKAHIKLSSDSKFLLSIKGVNGLPGQAGLQGLKGERGKFLTFI